MQTGWNLDSVPLSGALLLSQRHGRQRSAGSHKNYDIRYLFSFFADIKMFIDEERWVHHFLSLLLCFYDGVASQSPSYDGAFVRTRL